MLRKRGDMVVSNLEDLATTDSARGPLWGLGAINRGSRGIAIQGWTPDFRLNP